MGIDEDEIRVYRWETLSAKKFATIDRSESVVTVTCSPLEVHGPHLPLGADLLEGEGLMNHVMPLLPERHRQRTFLKLPMLYTATDPLPHPGSLYFRPTTTRRVLTDLGNSLAGQGFRNIIVSNFHGTPRHFLSIEKACHEVSRKRGVRMVSIFSILLARLTGGSSDLYEALRDIPGLDPENLIGDTHGGLIETSQLLALHPEWVERDYTELPRRTLDIWMREQGEEPPAIEPGKPAGLATMIKAFRGTLRFFRAETYSGAPGPATPELGRAILARLAQHAAQATTEILDGKLSPLDCHSPLWPQRFVFTNPLMIRFFNRLLRIPDGIS